jgi:WS/DGAT/MGAT family acyltransferase
MPLRLAGYAARGARRGVTMVSMAREGRGVVPDRVPRTVFNQPVGPRRRFAFCSVAMADVKALRRQHDVKVNDVVLAICAGALRRWLDERGELPDRPLLGGVPVSTRAEGDDSASNQLANMIVSLATDVDDPIERLLAIHESSTGAKEMTAAVRATEIPSMGEVAPPALLNTGLHALAATGVMSMLPTMMNVLISNVPGPAFPLYTGGARVTGIFSSSVIMESMGLNITVFSYMDRLDFGLVVDPDIVDDPWPIATAFLDTLAELLEASGLDGPTVVEDPLGHDTGARTGAA